MYDDIMIMTDLLLSDGRTIL